MDPKENSAKRRPLPTPNATPPVPIPAPRPSTPIAPVSFYSNSSSSKPPPLPARTARHGSKYTQTGYIPPTSQPPAYGSMESIPFREPELVEDDRMSEDDPVPALISQSDWQNESTPWDASWAGGNWQDQQQTNWNIEGTIRPKVYIDGQDIDEENNWWDPSVRERCQRPGSGFLPPVLADELHNPDHSLYSVSVTPPDIKPDPPKVIPPSTSSEASSSSSSSPLPAPASKRTSGVPPIPPPTNDDVRTAIPHPNAYYCPQDNGWVILIWKSSSVPPPLAKSFESSPHPPLPNQDRRRLTDSCIGEGETQFGYPSNNTHHFHKYEKAVDALKLSPPFRRNDWETMEKVKQKRRAATIILDDDDLQKLKDNLAEGVSTEDQAEEEGELLDLYVCCQCSFYVVASRVIPGVIPRKYFEEFVKEKMDHPPPGKAPEASVLVGWETLISLIETRLWKGEGRSLPVSRPAFQKRIGWGQAVQGIFETLKFTTQADVTGTILQHPPTDVISPVGRQNRAKFLRTWVELGAWVANYSRVHAAQLKDVSTVRSWVKVDSVREMYQTAIGAHPDQIPRGLLGEMALVEMTPLDEAWRSLGLTRKTYSCDLLAFAYSAQCRCDPAKTVDYFSTLLLIYQSLEHINAAPVELANFIMDERSRGRFTHDNIAQACQTLGFGAEAALKVDFEVDLEDDFLEGAWRDCVRRAWRDPQYGSQLQREANEAFRILAEVKGSAKLKKLWEAGNSMMMNPDRAYDTLEIPRDVDDAMLIPVFAMRLEELPLQIDKMREALTVIAEIRNSDRLRQYLATGLDPGDVVIPTRPDLPRGLNQLGNTCYLNSLLQYFYTIKELREAIAHMGHLDLKSVEDEKFSDDDLKRHRVGGRLVTRREIIRSKKFVSQLAELFFNLEYCEIPAVTPSLELAKLALVTSRDEEEDEDKGGTDSSNDTDATLVEDGPSRFLASSPTPETPRSPPRSSGSVLGKRSRDRELDPSAMDVDGSVADSPPKSTSPGPTEKSRSSSVLPEASTSKSVKDKDGDIDMDGPPSVPPKPNLPRKATEISDSVMMFGKQHDVAECMDNCMFQIETALLKFDTPGGPQADDKTSVVKRLFYGKIKQRVAVASDAGSSIHEKEDLFSHLPVNVTDDGVDIYDGLSGYFDDVVEFEGKTARMEVSLVQVPPLLQIQLQRVQFNRDTLQPYKSQAYVQFGETIYMDRFLDSADPQKKAQAKVTQADLTACRERLRLLVQGKDGPATAALSSTRDFLSKIALLDIDDELIFDMGEEQTYLEDEIQTLRTRIKELKDQLESIWRDETKVAYELTSVFIHRGSSPSWGHYFFYSRHLPDAPDSWFKYNDSDVTVVSKDEVLADTTNSTANPYLLVFARKGSDVVDTVKRFDPNLLIMDE